MSRPHTQVIRFAGHDLIITGDYDITKFINKAVTMLEGDPNALTDAFNASSASNEFYKFEHADASIQGEKHYLIALADKLQNMIDNQTTLPDDLYMILTNIQYALNTDGIGSTDPNAAQPYRVPSHLASHCKIYQFSEHALSVTGEMHDLVDLTRVIRAYEANGNDLSGTISDLAYKIEYAFDIDGIRSGDTSIPFDPDYANQYIKP